MEFCGNFVYFSEFFMFCILHYSIDFWLCIIKVSKFFWEGTV